MATTKHPHHDFQADRESADSWRRRAAGFACALIVSARQLGMVRAQFAKQPLEELVAEFCAGYDAVAAEGFKEAAVPRVEARLPDLPPPAALVADFSPVLPEHGGAGASGPGAAPLLPHAHTPAPPHSHWPHPVFPPDDATGLAICLLGTGGGADDGA